MPRRREKGWWAETAPRLGRRGPRLAASLMAMLMGVGAVSPARSQVRLTVPEALDLAFPEADVIERETAFLSAEQLREAARLAGPGVEVGHSVITYYRALRGGTVTGVAYFDSHIVRTLPEVVMIVVTPEARLERIEVLKFSEPPEYEAPGTWLDQFEGEKLSDALLLRRSIINMTGATLTSRAITHAVRRVLAVHAMIRPFEPDEADGNVR